MAELYMYQRDIVSKAIFCYVLIVTKYTKHLIFFYRTTAKEIYHEVFCLTS